MNDLDESDTSDSAASGPIAAGGVDALFGDYAVLSPGVQIVIEGRPVSAPAGD